jgi:DNA-binding response OmpR family regulator
LSGVEDVQPRLNLDLPSPLDRGPAHVLVVDDDPDLRQTISAVLSDAHYTATAVGTGPGALSILDRGGVDLLVLDVAMPEMSGVEVCRHVRNNMRTLHLPIIMLTSRVQVRDETEGMLAGADVYLTKPVNPHWLLANVRKLLNSP